MAVKLWNYLVASNCKITVWAFSDHLMYFCWLFTCNQMLLCLFLLRKI